MCALNQNFQAEQPVSTILSLSHYNCLFYFVATPWQYMYQNDDFAMRSVDKSLQNIAKVIKPRYNLYKKVEHSVKTWSNTLMHNYFQEEKLIITWMTVTWLKTDNKILNAVKLFLELHHFYITKDLNWVPYYLEPWTILVSKSLQFVCGQVSISCTWRRNSNYLHEPGGKT